MGFGLPRLLNAYNEIIDGFIKVTLSLAFAFSLFTYRTPEGSAFAFLDSPLAVAAVVMILCCSVFLAPYLTTVGARIFAKASDDNNYANRLFGFYNHVLIEGSARAKDTHLQPKRYD